jgi:hypothetical protein
MVFEIFVFENRVEIDHVTHCTFDMGSAVFDKQKLFMVFMANGTITDF